MFYVNSDYFNLRNFRNFRRVYSIFLHSLVSNICTYTQIDDSMQDEEKVIKVLESRVRLYKTLMDAFALLKDRAEFEKAKELWIEATHALDYARQVLKVS